MMVIEMTGIVFTIQPTSSSVYVFNHVTTTPGTVRGVAVCQTAEFGYSVGDELGVEFIDSEYGTAVVRPAVMLATNSIMISAIFAMANDDAGSSHGGHLIPNAGINGNPDETLTAARWKFKVYYI